MPVGDVDQLARPAAVPRMVLAGGRVLVLVEGPRGGALEDKMDTEMLL